MASYQFCCEIAASKDALWQTLMDEVDNPQEFNSTIQSATTLERFHSGVLRVIEIPDATIRERVEFSFEDGEIISRLLDHPQVSGVIKKQLTIDAPGQTTLNCSIQWDSTSGKIDAMIQRNVEAFVLDTVNTVKSRAESSPSS